MTSTIFYLIGFFAFGSCLGSFSGVLLETHIKRPFWTGRSQCLSCREKLRWYELIPVFSYIFQWGKCRHCHIHIPRSVFLIEFLMGLLWVVMGSIFIRAGFTLGMTLLHLIPLSMFLILAIEDGRSCIIPDRLSLPIILITIVIIFVTNYTGNNGLFLSWPKAIAGAGLGMLFYLLQMVIPALFAVLRKKKYMQAFTLLSTPLFFPFWLALKLLGGEKKADKHIPSIAILDAFPTWVGGGDVRLGIFVGLLTGPLYFLWTVGIGYTCGSIFWLAGRIGGKKNIDVLPVAPLLFLGFCVVWAALLMI